MNREPKPNYEWATDCQLSLSLLKYDQIWSGQCIYHRIMGQSWSVCLIIMAALAVLWLQLCDGIGAVLLRVLFINTSGPKYQQQQQDSAKQLLLQLSPLSYSWLWKRFQLGNETAALEQNVHVLHVWLHEGICRQCFCKDLGTFECLKSQALPLLIDRSKWNGFVFHRSQQVCPLAVIIWLFTLSRFVWIQLCILHGSNKLAHLAISCIFLAATGHHLQSSRQDGVEAARLLVLTMEITVQIQHA